MSSEHSSVPGEKPLAETIEKVKIRTRRFARRQETWFRGLSECRPVAMDDAKPAGEIAAEIAAL